MNDNWKKILNMLKEENINEDKPYIFIHNNKIYVIDENKPFVEQIINIVKGEYND